jgi:hypothetical protein
MTKKRDFTFKGKVRHNAEKRERDRSFSYLIMPSEFDVYVPDPGRIDLDIIPYIVTDENHPDRDEEYGEALVGEPWYCRPFKIHRNVGPDGDTVVCLESIGQKCPICEYRKQLAAQDDKENEEEIKALKAKDRMLYYILPLDDDWEDDFHIFDISYHNFHNELDAEIKEDPDYENFAHPEEGLTLSIRWERSKWGDQKFCKANRVDFNKREHEGYTWEEIEELPSLDDIILKSIRSYDELERLFMGAGGDEADKEEFGDPDEPPATERKRKPRGSRTRKEPEESKEKETSTRTRTRTRKPKEDAEEKPKGRTRTRKPKEDKEDGCPYGHEFGADLDKFDDCENCSSWDACNDANKKLK